MVSDSEKRYKRHLKISGYLSNHRIPGYLRVHRLAMSCHIAPKAPKAPLIIEQTTTLDHIF